MAPVTGKLPTIGSTIIIRRNGESYCWVNDMDKYVGRTGKVAGTYNNSFYMMSSFYEKNEREVNSIQLEGQQSFGDVGWLFGINDWSPVDFLEEELFTLE